jgi:APA family basic amino acid/polyamine antiporter
VYALRRKRPELERPYRTLGYPLTPALFLLATLFLLGSALWEDVGYFSARFQGLNPVTGSSGALMILGIILLGVPAYYLWAAFEGRH